MSEDDYSQQDDGSSLEAKEDSSLTLPLTIIGVTLLLCLGFLYYYFGPSVSELAGEVADPSGSSAIVHLTVQDTAFDIPINFTRFPKDRRGGVRNEVSLYALLPDLEPFSPGKKEIFKEESKTSPVIYFEIGPTPLLNEAERMEKLYKDHIAGQAAEGPDGLLRYTFDGSTGFKDEDLLVYREGGKVLAVLRCYQETGTINMPTCRREQNISDTLAITYLYQRHWLPQWRTIDEKVRTLVESWKVPQKTGQAETPATGTSVL